jgi:uncharacterized protein
MIQNFKDIEHTNIVVQDVEHWLAKVVVGLNLCPFAKAPMTKAQIRTVVCHSAREEDVAQMLYDELVLIRDTPGDQIETTLVVTPKAFERFETFNDFLDIADGMLDQLELVGEIQVASFHPLYQFEGSEPDDVENYTNRAPYPIFHLLREESVTKALTSGQNADDIIERNMQTVRNVGIEGLRALMKR